MIFKKVKNYYLINPQYGNMKKKFDIFGKLHI